MTILINSILRGNCWEVLWRTATWICKGLLWGTVPIEFGNVLEMCPCNTWEMLWSYAHAIGGECSEDMTHEIVREGSKLNISQNC